MAVHLDIRPRIRLPPEPPVARRPRRRLPPLAVPAVGYWIAMGALTYFLAHLGPHPLDALMGSAEPTAAAQTLEPAVPDAAPPSPKPGPAPRADARPEAPEAPSFVPEAEEAASPPSLAETAAPPPGPTETRGERSERARREPEPTARLDPPRPAAEAPGLLSFPEFSDSSAPERREHAADGPRIDSLFEPADDRAKPPASSAPGPSRSPGNEAPSVAVTSCEAAIARNNEELTIGGPRGAADISRESYAAILQDGRYLTSCRIPERTVFEICAAVKDGHAVGITVVSNPSDAQLNGCVRSAVARLRFPSSPKLDVTHTRFEAVAR